MMPDPRVPLAYDGSRFILDAFLAQVARTPDATAIVTDAHSISYRALLNHSAALASQLRALGCGPGGTVVVVADRNASLVVALLAALLARVRFFIADAAYPLPRLQQCASQLTPNVVLACGDKRIESLAHALRDALPGAPVDVVCVNADATNGDVDVPDASSPDVSCKPSALDAYVMFTSGSTGQPKAVVTAHPPLVHFIEWHVRTHALNATMRFALLSGLSHDPMLRDVFTPLSIGATLCIPAQTTLFDPVALAAWLLHHRVAVLHVTPALGGVLAEGVLDAPTPQPLTALRWLFFGGDSLNRTVSQRVRAAAPHAQQVNFYGATETPQAMAHHLIAADDDTTSFPIGRAIDDVQLLIMHNGALCPVGEPGEIWVRSRFLSRGYASGQPARFVVNPFTGDVDDICYQTGDLGSYDSQGNVKLLGRVDHQVKIRGFRVELGDVVAALERIDGVQRAVVLAKDLPTGRALVAYFATGTSGVTGAQARAALTQTLPAYMVPSFAVALAAFALLPNGKIDLAALPQPTAAAGTASAPTTPQQRALVELWQELLQLPQVSLDDSFADLGGDSLTALRALVRMRRLGVSQQVARGILQGRTIRQIASGDVGPVTPPARAAQQLWMHALRGALVLVLVTDHWLEGFASEWYQLIAARIGLLLNIATPGFALLFGASLGEMQYRQWLAQPSAVRRRMHQSALLLIASVVVLGGIKVLTRVALQQPLQATAVAMSFMSPLDYYALALLTAPLWFTVMRRIKKPSISIPATILTMLVLSKIVFTVINDAQVSGLLYLFKELVIAKFNYFKMSAAVLCGMAAGMALRARTQPPHALTLMGLAGAGAVVALAALRLGDGNWLRLGDADDMRAWRWLFGAAALAAIGAVLRALLSRAPSSLRRLGTVGQAAFALFVLHIAAVDIYHLLLALGVHALPATALSIVPVGLVAAALLRRLFALYHAPS